MSEVTRVNDPNIAPLDGVALGAKCIVTRFSTAKNKVVSIKSQEMADCSIKASMELGSAVLDERGQVCELKAKVACLESFRHENNMTIMELKAKLYDLMVEKEG